MTDGNNVRHMEVSMYGLFSGSNSHGRVITGATEINLFAAGMFEPDERIIRGHLRVVAVSICLRQSIQLASANAIAVSVTKDLGYMADVRAPPVVGCSTRSKDLEIGGAI